MRVIKVEKNDWEDTNSNEQGPESRISVTSYTPVYEYTVNGQQYEYHTRLGSSTDQYPIGNECPGYYFFKRSKKKAARSFFRIVFLHFINRKLYLSSECKFISDVR